MRCRIALAFCLAAAGGAAAQSAAAEPIPRPEIRIAVPETRPARASNVNIAFGRWIEGFRGRALAQGIRQEVLDRAFRNMRYNADVIGRDRNQTEFVLKIQDYIGRAVSETRVRNGAAALKRHRDTLKAIERRYGVEKEVVAAIWGLESSYGSTRGRTPAIEALATLAFDGRRGQFFEEQLLAALKILQSGDTTPDRLRGSWAGAMGHTQFIPTSYLEYAQDFDGDGRRDIWSDDPADSLASTAAYLSGFGWTKGQPWGIEVTLPSGFDFATAGPERKMQASAWARLGVRGIDGEPIPNRGPASIFLPSGARGGAFMIFDNFRVIKRYNASDAYALAVGHLSDRLKGGGPFQTKWPGSDRPLLRAERVELQERLTRKGFDTGGADGIIGPNTVAALRRYQTSVGMVPDGYASLSILQKLR